MKDRPDSRLEKLGRLLIRARLIVVVLVTAITAWFGAHALDLKMETRFDEMLPKDHPFLAVHRENAETFGGANTVLIMIEKQQGTIFDTKTLGKIFAMTEEIDKIYGVNHYAIESIAHRTNRMLVVGSGGLMEMQPVMSRPPTTDEEVRRVARIVHTSQNLYGVLVSLDDKSALIRASFIEGRLDHRRLFAELRDRIVAPYEDAETKIYVAGEPQLYGWIYAHAGEAVWILAGTVLLSWLMLHLYFRDWRGALRPTLTGFIAAVWGLGFLKLLGFALDPLTLVIPFFVTARAISHSAQMHERYYEEYLRCDDRDDAIVRSFAALFLPTLSGIATDALGVLAILLVPIELLQKLAMVASFWIAAIAVSELLLNPVVYSLLGSPDREVLEARTQGLFQRLIDRLAAFVTSGTGRRVVFVGWAVVIAVGASFWTRLVIGDPDSVTPLLHSDSPYNVAHRRIQDQFGGVEPLIVVASTDKKNRGALRLPQNVRAIESFQRHMEKDPAIGASFSFVDVITTMGAAMNDLEYKWAVIPSTERRVSLYFGSYFMGTSYAETARFMDPDFSKTAVFFYCANHQGPTIRRIIQRAKDYIAAHPLERAEYQLAGGLVGVLAAVNEELLRNDVILNVVGYATILLIVCLTYRSFVAGLLLTTPLFVANALVHAYMGARGIGVNVHTLPVITVGIGFGIDFAFYVVSRAREELDISGDITEAVSESVRTAGKAVAFSALTMIAGVLLWSFSSIRFNAEMGTLLAIWMASSFTASITLLPALLVSLQPKFLSR